MTEFGDFVYRFRSFQRRTRKEAWSIGADPNESPAPKEEVEKGPPKEVELMEVGSKALRFEQTFNPF